MKYNFFKNMIKIDNISNKEKLALSITVLVLVVVIMSVLVNLNDDEVKVEYENFNVENAIKESITTTNRQIYVDLNEIISNYLAAYNMDIKAADENVDFSKIKYTREEYYNVLSDDYKKKLSKKDYMRLSEEFCDKFITTSKYGEYVEIKNNNINNIYILPSNKYGKNMYMCKLNTAQKGSTAYIGLNLDQVQKIYSIFYIE